MLDGENVVAVFAKRAVVDTLGARSARNARARTVAVSVSVIGPS
jgi:hypothetical protein